MRNGYSGLGLNGCEGTYNSAIEVAAVESVEYSLPR